METTMLTGEGFFGDKLTPLFMPFKHGDIIAFNDPLYNYSENPVLNTFQMYVWGPSNWTKRVIGLPGDHIEGKIENGVPVVYRNGGKLDESYVNQYPLVATYDPNRGRQFIYKTFVPEIALSKQSFHVFTYQEVFYGEQAANQIGEDVVRYPHTPNHDHVMRGDDLTRPFDVYDVMLGPDEFWVMGDNRQSSTDSRAWGKLKRKLIHGKIIFRIWSQESDEGWMLVDLIKHPVDFFMRIRWGRCLQLVK